MNSGFIQFHAKTNQEQLGAALLSWKGFQSLRCHRFPNMSIFMQEIDPRANILKGSCIYSCIFSV